MESSATHTMEPPDGRTMVKGAMVRAMVDVLRKRGHYARVEPRLDPRVRAFLEHPPATTAWVDFSYLEHLGMVLEQLVGPNEAQSVSLEAIRNGFPSIITVFIGGLLRLFGSSPHTVFTRLPEILAQTCKGMSVEYVRTGDRSGTVRVTYVHRAHVTIAPMRAWGATAQIVFELCGVRGTAGDIVVLPATPNALSLDLHW